MIENLNQIKKAKHLILNNSLWEAIEILKKYEVEISSIIYKKLFEEQLEAYKFLLKYFSQGVKDENRQNIYKSIQKKLLHFADYVSLELKARFFQSNILFNWKQIIERENKTIAEILDLNLEDQENLKQAFYTLVFTPRYSVEAIGKLKEFFENYPNVYYKSLFVSAIFLSLILIFDERKFEILLEIYKQQESLVWERALVSLVLGLLLYNKRLDLFSDLKINFKKTLETIDSDAQQILIVVSQLIKAKETPNIVKKFEQEILPQMHQFSEEFIENINIDEIISENSIDEENPEWQKVFGKMPDFMEKMEEFSKMQLEGSDVLVTAFDKLKDFEFFNEPMNWFMPFYLENPLVKQITEEIVNYKDLEQFPELVKGLFSTFYMCDSDKYSFILNFRQMPHFQQKMLIDLFSLEVKTMEEIKADEELFNENFNSQNVITHYIQDLYRFFKISKFSGTINDVVVDIFNLKTDFYNSKAFEILDNYHLIISNAAEMYFSKQFYLEAINHFQKLLLFETENEYFIYEKIAFAYQKMKDYKNALDFYKKAEIFESNQKWILKKIGYNYMKLGEYEKAIDYFEKVLSLDDEEDLQIDFYIANCLVNLKQYEKAIKYLFKIEYHKPNQPKIVEAIAWVYFLMGKFESVIKYYQKLDSLSYFDYLNLGFSYWFLGDYKSAIEKLKLSFLKFTSSDIQKFKDFYFNQVNEIKSFGLDDFTLNLIFDTIISDVDKNF